MSSQAIMNVITFAARGTTHMATTKPRYARTPRRSPPT